MPRLIPPPPPPPPAAAGRPRSIRPMSRRRERPTHGQTGRWVGGETTNDERNETNATNETKQTTRSKQQRDGGPNNTEQATAHGGEEGRALSQN